MKLNRRNVLVGLGTIVAGGGAALGTGAFSSVVADRTVSVGTAGDGNSYLGISVTESNYVDDISNDGVVKIGLGKPDNDDIGFNEKAITNIDRVLSLSNNSNSEQIEVSLGEEDEHSESQTVEVDGLKVTFTLSETDGDEIEYKTLQSDEGDSSVTIDIEVNTTEETTDEDELTLYATTTSAN